MGLRSQQNVSGSALLPDTSTIGAIILAAGFSRRFGSIKLNAPLPDGQTVLQKSFNNAAQVFDEIIVAGRPALDEQGIYDSLLLQPSRQLILCDDADHGMGHTLACGARAIPANWDACFVFLADMPFIRPATLRTLSREAGPERVVLPVWQGQRGHPIGFGRHYFARLCECSGDSGARHLLSGAVPLTPVEVDDPGVVQDIDTPADLPG